MFLAAASDSNQNKLDLWNLAVQKRKLQLSGVYPIIALQNGKMVRVYVNQKSPFPTSNNHTNSSVKHGNQPKTIAAAKKGVLSGMRRGKSEQFKNSNQTKSTPSTLPLSTSFIRKASSSTAKPTTRITNKSIERREKLMILLKKESYMKHIGTSDTITMKSTEKLMTKTHTKRTTNNIEVISSSHVTTSCNFEFVIIIPVCGLFSNLLLLNNVSLR